ncbi:LuxR C-terminal-related transcriptional regulator [Acidocella sp.]|uniref:LuxR C-terminal-related transcriptional regulator n=1 Tax=Acidocella sp. TaxID=50710 RepID=UPI002617C018|nr:LuxR C-terminal-related transcriptional regulator [Acidocella sp.]
MSVSVSPRLLATKTQRPKLPPRLVARPRVLAQLEGAAPRMLTLIKAAAGFGKTSLAIAWAEHLAARGHRIAWVSLDPEDDEPGQFLLYVAQALRGACPEIEGQALDLISEVALLRPFDVVRLLLNGLADLDDDVFLFLDDYHVLQSPEVAECAGYLVKHAPAQLHLVLTTRTEPNLPLVRLRAQGQLCELDATALRFDLEETAQFLAAEQLGPDAALTLHEKTEGWPVMMRIIAATSLQAGVEFAGYVRQLSVRNRPIRSHLADMLGGLPPEMVSFLTRCAVLEHLCAPLCAHVTGQPDATAIFETLISRQLLLTPLDADGVWFRLHPLLRGFLVQRLDQETPDTMAALHRRAYGWFAEAQLWTDAIRHAIAVGDTAEAARWVENCAMALLKRGELTTLFAWERTFGPELLRKQVKARLAIAWGMALAMRFDEAIARASRLEAELGSADAQARAALGCECQTIRAVALALSDHTDAALALAEDSLKQRSSGPWTTNTAANVAVIGWWKRAELERCYHVPWISFPGDDGARNVVATTYRLCLLGLVDDQQLHHQAATRQFGEAMRVASAHAGPLSAAAAQPACLLAQELYDQGRADEAEALLSPRLPLVNAVCMIECVIRAYTVLVRVNVARGAREAAERLLEGATQLALSRRWVRLEARLLHERARMALRAGLGEEAASFVARLQHLRATVQDRQSALVAEVQAELDQAGALAHQARGETTQAIALARSAKAQARAHRNRRRELEATALLAALQDGPEAEAALREALALAEGSGHVQLFLDLLPFAAASFAGQLKALAHKPEGTALAGFAHQIAARLPGERAAPPARAELSLSPRETDILQLLVSGQTNKAIARQLNVTPETIKTHIKRIFQKLNVTNRSQAVSRYYQNRLGG